MSTPQGDLSLLQHPVAQELLHSKIPARIAYVARDGTPRVVPVWFHWDGREVVIATPSNAPKVRSLRDRPRVAITIDDNTFPNKVLLIRGIARLSEMQGVVPEYALAAERYFSPAEGRAWVKRLGGMLTSMVRIAVTPDWVAVLDYETRFPSALSNPSS